MDAPGPRVSKAHCQASHAPPLHCDLGVLIRLGSNLELTECLSHTQTCGASQAETLFMSRRSTLGDYHVLGLGRNAFLTTMTNSLCQMPDMNSSHESYKDLGTRTSKRSGWEGRRQTVNRIEGGRHTHV